MKITRKILENLIKEELSNILSEAGVGALGMDSTIPRPSAEQLRNDPVASYIIQRTDSMFTRVEEMMSAMEDRLQELEKTGANQGAIANSPKDLSVPEL